MNMKNKPEILDLVNTLSSSYYYQPLFVKGAEELVFLEGTASSKYRIIMLTTIDFTNVLEKTKVVEKIKLVLKKLDITDESKALVLSFNKKRYTFKDRNINVFHLFNDNIPEEIYDNFPAFEELTIFDDFVDKLKEDEKEEKEKDIKENRITDKTIFSGLMGKKDKKAPQSSIKDIEENKFEGKITKKMLYQNAITKFIIIVGFIISLALQLIIPVPNGGSSFTSIIAFGGAYNPFVYGLDGAWRLFTFAFISNSVFSFAFMAIMFYFFSRMSESFYGGVRYLIIFFVGYIISGLISTQLFPDVIFYGLSLPLWVMIGATGTFVVAKWRNIAVSLKVKYFLYSFLILIAFGIFGNLGSNIEAGLIALLIGIVLGIGVQFKTSIFKENWKKSLNPMIAVFLLLITSITLPLVTKRIIPLQASNLNQSVLITYQKYNLISKSAREKFQEMNESYFLVSNNKSSCLWNYDIRFAGENGTIADSEKSKLNDLNTKITEEFKKSDSTVFSSQDAEISNILALFSADTFSTLATNLNELKTNLTTFKDDRSTINLKAFNDTYFKITSHLKSLSLTEQLSIIGRRTTKVYEDVNKWNEISNTSESSIISPSVVALLENPSGINVENFRNTLKKLKVNVDSNIAGVDPSFKTTLDSEINNLGYWCINTNI